MRVRRGMGWVLVGLIVLLALGGCVTGAPLEDTGVWDHSRWEQAVWGP